ncbi:MAG: Ig-like domain-containing protein [Acutalibacteraceae bacterium]
MKKSFNTVLKIFAAVMLLCILSVFSVSAGNTDDKWITAWGTAPTEIGIDGYENITAFIGNVTARSVITPTASGTKLRIRVSNYYGNSEMTLTRVTVGKSTGNANVDPSTVKIVTFNEGHQNISVPAGKEYYSDPVTFDVKAGEDIAISIYVKDFTEIKTMGLSGAETYLAIGDDYTSSGTMGVGTMLDNKEIIEYLLKYLGQDIDIKLAYSFIKVVPCLASVDVLSDENAYSVVVVGDSTVSNEFPLYLAQALHEKGVTNVGIVGKGIIGNRLLGEGLGYGSLIFGESMLDRFERDVLSQSGVKYVIVKIGANDIMHPVCSDIVEQYPDIKQPTWQEICAGYRKVFQMCHNVGIKVIPIGITQWKGNTRDYLGTGGKYIRTQEEFEADWQIALDVNNWLATTTEHDGYVYFNDISANPKDPDAFYPEYTIDGAHPSATLQKIWGDSFPQSLIGVGKFVAGVGLNKTSAKAYIGTKGTLVANVYPSTAENKQLKWTSSNPEIVSVDQKGAVECLTAGTAVITCETVDGGHKASCVITVYSKPTSITLNKSSGKMYATKSGKLTATVLPADAYDTRVTWSSSNEKVAVVDKNGVVTAVGSGNVVITAKTVVGGLTASCNITVLKKTEVVQIGLNKTSGSMYKGATYQLKAVVMPENATYKQVKWSSSNSSVVSVDQTGLIKGLKAGNATIYCKSVDNPGVTAACNVRVVVKTTGVKLSHSKASIYAGYGGTLKATVYPADATDKRIVWTSSNTKVATVSSSGYVKGISKGTAVITAKTVNGGYTASCTINVYPVIKSTSVKLSATSGTVDPGTYYQFKYKVYPENTTNKKVVWSTSNSNVVKVNQSGVIYANSPGTAVITCKTADTGKTATCKVTVRTIVPTSVTLNKTSGSMNYGKSYQLVAKVLPENATDRRVTWTSSNPSAVSVSSTGVIKALKPNSSAVITCKTVSGGKTATCKVTVRPISVTNVTLNKTALNMTYGDIYTLKATVYPSNASVKTVTWGSTNTAVATVTQSGVVTAKGKGAATVYCKTKDGGFIAKCTVQVTDIPVLGVMLNRSSFTGSVGDSFTLKATVFPENATNQKVTWESTDTAVAKVSSGKVTLVGKGTCQIKVKTVDGNYVEVCRVVVS